MLEAKFKAIKTSGRLYLLSIPPDVALPRLPSPEALTLHYGSLRPSI